MTTTSSNLVFIDPNVTIAALGACTGGGAPGIPASCPLAGITQLIVLTGFENDIVDLSDFRLFGGAAPCTNLADPDHCDAFVSGGSGNDVLIGGPRNEHFNTGSGIDTVQPGAGANLIAGESEDTLLGLPATDVADSYVVTLTPGSISMTNTIAGGLVFTSTNTVLGTFGLFRLDLLEGNDELTVTGTSAPVSALRLDGSGGSDFMKCPMTNVPATILGGDGDDEIGGSSMSDRLEGGSGNDSLVGNGGNDILLGGDGADHFNWISGDGLDQLEGGSGEDKFLLLGTAGVDRVSYSVDAFGVLNVIVDAAALLTVKGMEMAELELTTGADDLQVGDLTGSGLTKIFASLGADGASDTVFLEGQPVADDVQVSLTQFALVRVTGLAAVIEFTATEAIDRIVIKGRDGDDVMRCEAAVETKAGVLLDGGPGNDTLAGRELVGGDGDDILRGNTGGSTLFGDGASNIAVVLTTTNALARLRLETSPSMFATVPITGLQAAESILAIDFRPATDRLYGISDQNRLYILDYESGAATLAGALSVPLAGAAFGIDFNPTVDRLRIVSNLDQNLRVNPNTGEVLVDTPLAYAPADPNAGANPNVVAVAYTNSYLGATATTLYGIDSNLDILVTLASPNNGQLTTVGPLTVDTSDVVAFDIVPGSNTGYAILTIGGTRRLSRIDLSTGTATSLGFVSGAAFLGLAVIPAAGHDTITGASGNDVLVGGAGDDTLVGGPGADSITGEDGNDRMIWNNGDGSDVLNGNGGIDIVEVNGSPTSGDVFTIAPGVAPRVAFARTSPGPFTLDIGTAERLVVNGLGGDDTMTATAALTALITLTLDGGDGNDTITGADGRDDLRGGPGNDALTGAAGVDILAGGDGDDTLAGGDDSDDLQGGPGNDVLVGGGGNDTLLGGDGNDTLTGTTGSDPMFGNAGDDRLIWNNGDGTDLMEGGDGTDTIEVNGAAALGDVFVVSPNGARVRFDRTNLGTFSLDIGTAEQLVVNPLGGDDSVTLSPGVSLVSATVNGGDGADAIALGSGLVLTTATVNGGDGNDTIILGPALLIAAATVNGDAGDDIVNVVAQPTAVLTVNGGAHTLADALNFNADCQLVSSAAGVLTAEGRQPLVHSLFETINTTNSFAISPASLAFPGNGGSASVAVTTGPTCSWTTSASANWLTLAGTTSGQGSGAVTVTAALNPGGARSTSISVAGRTVPVTQADFSSALVRRYLPEGATSTFFDTSFALLNPNADAATVTLHFERTNAAEAVKTLTMPPLSRATVDAKSVLGAAAAEFSTIVESFPPVVVDRTMTFDATGYGSHAETSIEAPGLTWHIAEGSTESAFNLFYLLQNPNEAAADVQVTYLRPAPAPPIVRGYTVPGKSRFNIWVNLVDPALVNTPISAMLASTNGVTFLVERSMYLNAGGQFFAAGLESAAVAAPGLNWFFGEGATGAFFDTFLLLSNPNAAASNVTISYLLPAGGTVVKNYVVAGNSRQNVWVDTEDPALANTAVSSTVVVTNGVPIVAERSMWWPGPTTATWLEAHASVGATQTGAKWALAAGEVGGPTATQTFVLIANTSAFAGTAKVTLVLEDGTSAVRTFGLSANSRVTVDVGASFPESVDKKFGVIVESLGATPAQLVVERSMYSNANGVFFAAGTNALGTRIP